MGRYQHAGRHGQIHRGDADGAADALTVLHRAAETVAVSQKLRRPLHVARLDQRADVGGADGDTVMHHLGDDVAAQPQLGAFLLQELGVSGVFMAEAVVVTRHQMHRAIALDQQLCDKILPRHGHHLVVEGGQYDPVDAVEAADQRLPVLRGVDEVHRLAGDHLLGWAVKGKDGRLRAQRTGALRRFLQQGAVAPVYAVKKAEGYYSSFQSVHAPKKFFWEVRTPPSARLRHKKAPSPPYTRYRPSGTAAVRGLPQRQRRSSSAEGMV